MRQRKEFIRLLGTFPIIPVCSSQKSWIGIKKTHTTMKLLLSLLSVFVSVIPLASAQNLAEVATTNGFSTLVATATASGLAPALVDPAAQLSKF
jgi:hypothetical protein